MDSKLLLSSIWIVAAIFAALLKTSHAIDPSSFYRDLGDGTCAFTSLAIGKCWDYPGGPRYCQIDAECNEQVQGSRCCSECFPGDTYKFCTPPTSAIEPIEKQASNKATVAQNLLNALIQNKTAKNLAAARNQQVKGGGCIAWNAPESCNMIPPFPRPCKTDADCEDFGRCCSGCFEGNSEKYCTIMYDPTGTTQQYNLANHVAAARARYQQVQGKCMFPYSCTKIPYHSPRPCETDEECGGPGIGYCCGGCFPGQPTKYCTVESVSSAAVQAYYTANQKNLARYQQNKGQCTSQFPGSCLAYKGDAPYLCDKDDECIHEPGARCCPGCYSANPQYKFCTTRPEVRNPSTVEKVETALAQQDPCPFSCHPELVIDHFTDCKNDDTLCPGPMKCCPNVCQRGSYPLFVCTRQWF